MSSVENNVENGSAEESPAVEAEMDLTLDSDTEQETVPEAVAPETVVVAAEEEKKWPGWPGFCVFRMVVPVMKVGSIIGRKGELIKKMCEETKARIRVLDGPLGNPDRIVLITGKEEPGLPLSPAMDAVIRVFKRVNDLSEGETDGASGGVSCSIRLLVASSQGMSLIGKQGSVIKSMQETTGASIRVLNSEELPVYAIQDERIAELQGESAKVLKALEAVLGHLRKFLVDQTVLPLFEKSYNAPAPATATVAQDHQVNTWAEKSLLFNNPQHGITIDYPPSLKNELLFLKRESQLEQRLSASRVPLYDQESGLSGLRSSGLGRAAGPIVTQVAQTMQIPLTYAEDIIGIQGANIAYIRRSSGAVLTVQESRGLADEITVEIKGTSLQVQTAQQLIQEFVSNHKKSASSSYGQVDADLRASSYSQLGGSAYSSSSMSTQPYSGGYGSSGLGGYGSYRY